ncbi:hypothetical protein [Apilactobacillus xinyiensis]|uniref:hypothetical protein n=1 Tax=Apilactobacillus xinyiensis TaxID=2841032 RepID=UPI00200BCF0F|nr:hypothetical protein [Apilactobacillus xinyiensis]MCL0319221.1 hypothetical protein [Apilactobacillus xinyiensis]
MLKSSFYAILVITIFLGCGVALPTTSAKNKQFKKTVNKPIKKTNKKTHKKHLTKKIQKQLDDNNTFMYYSSDNQNTNNDNKPKLLAFNHYGPNNNVNIQKIQSDNTIHYKVTNTDPSLKINIQAAVNNWNKLNVIKLKEVNVNDDSAHINIGGVIHNNQHMTKDTLGITGTYTGGSSMSSKNHKINYIVNANINFSKQLLCMSEYSQTRVIEHEIGHALGFADEEDDLQWNDVMYANHMDTEDSNNELGKNEAYSLDYYYDKY